MNECANNLHEQFLSVREADLLVNVKKCKDYEIFVIIMSALCRLCLLWNVVDNTISDPTHWGAL